jgi:acetolactate synthase-1/2/3 large subunit
MDARTGGQILIDQLVAQGVKHIFCVPGESYLPALDALYDTPSIHVTVCRNEAGAAMMAEAHGKLTGQPGVCFVTRGPGATNASPGVHIARQDSTPMILLVGQISRGMCEREAFQELDYRAVFGSLAKWATQIESAGRIPEIIARAFNVAMSGRPGPVVIALPEDTLTEPATCSDAPRVIIRESVPDANDVATIERLLGDAQRPIIIAGGSRWDENTSAALKSFAEHRQIPVAVSFRRQSIFPGNHPNYIGDLGVAANPALLRAVEASDLVMLLGTRLSEVASNGYTLLEIPKPKQTLIHVHPDPGEIGRIYQPTLGITVSPRGFFTASSVAVPVERPGYVENLRRMYLDWSSKPTDVPGRFNLGKVMVALHDGLPDDAILTNGAGNYSAWINRFVQFRPGWRLLAPTSGSMGYGVPAAVAALVLNPRRRVLAFAGDGCFLMNGQEFATAVQYDLPLIVIVIDNGCLGTIRMHQEQNYPGRVVATNLRNPDFAAYAQAFGGHGERVERTEDFMAALQRSIASGKPAIIHCLVDVEALSPGKSLSQVRLAAVS